MNKLYKEAYDQFAGDDWPSYEEYIAGNIDDSSIKLELEEFEKQSAKANSYDYNSRRPTHIH